MAGWPLPLNQAIAAQHLGFSLSSRGTSEERAGERRNPTIKMALLSPTLSSLLKGGEGEKALVSLSAGSLIQCKFEG
jgi:hypothetical protein